MAPAVTQITINRKKITKTRSPKQKIFKKLNYKQLKMKISKREVSLGINNKNNKGKSQILILLAQNNQAIHQAHNLIHQIQLLNDKNIKIPEKKSLLDFCSMATKIIYILFSLPPYFLIDSNQDDKTLVANKITKY